MNNSFPKLDLKKISSLTFEEPDFEVFTCLKLAYEAIKIGGTMPAVLNAANERAVELFLRQEIAFVSIPEIISEVMSLHKVVYEPTIEEILEADRHARGLASDIAIKRTFRI